MNNTKFKLNFMSTCRGVIVFKFKFKHDSELQVELEVTVCRLGGRYKYYF